MSHGLPAPAFPLSTRLLAAERLLKERPLRSWLVWLSTYAEIFSFTTLLLVHLFCSSYVAVALVVVVYVLGSLRAWSFLDVILSPVHLLRPCQHSKLGLGSKQRSANCFYLTSGIIQSVCALYISLNVWTLWPVILDESIADNFEACHMRSVYHTTAFSRTDHGFFSNYITGEELDQVVRECESGSSYSHWCGVVQNISLGCRAQFGGLVADALVGLGATCSDGLANETIIQEAAARVQRAAGVADEQAWLEEDSFATFQISMPLAQQLTLVCDSWQSLVADVTSSAPCTVKLDAGICATTEEVRFNHDMVNFASVCTFSACRNAVPEWMATPFEENSDFDWYCNCMQCRPFWMENFCSTLTVGIAVLTQMRESDIFGYNSLSWLMIIILTLIALTPLLVLLIHLSWWCWIGWPWAVPRDMDLEQKIERAAAQIQEELELQGSIKSTWWERLSMRWEFWQYVLDFGSDVFLIVQFLQYYHYIFAAMQASIVLLTAREELCTLGLRRLYRALRESLQYGLKTDDFLRLGQSERTIEGPLSLMLLAYTSFYMSTDTWAYLTALFSMIMSTSSVAKGCYYDLDLALNSLALQKSAKPSSEVVSNEESRRSQDGEVAEVSTVPSASPEETGAVALGGRLSL